MKKNQNDRDPNNIILFPGLKHRLYEKGIAQMEAHDFQEAADLLREAKELDPNNAEISTAYLVALYESSDYKEAKIIADELLHEGTGDYYEIIDIYLMILIQLKEHDQVVHTIEALFEEKEVPFDKVEHFRTLLGLSKKVIGNEQEQQPERFSINQHFFNELDLHEQTFQLGSLADKNIHPYLDTLLQMLENKQSHPFLQTIVLNVLRENKINQEVTVRKLHYDGQFIPTNLPEVGQMPIFQSIERMLEEQVEQHNPVLFTQLQEMMDRHAFILYPFTFEINNSNLWALAYRGLGYDMYGEDWNKEKLAATHNVDVKELLHAITLLTELEQISSPII